MDMNIIDVRFSSLEGLCETVRKMERLVRGADVYPVDVGIVGNTRRIILNVMKLRDGSLSFGVELTD